MVRYLENQRLLPSFLSLFLHSENPNCSVLVQGQPLPRKLSGHAGAGLVSCISEWYLPCCPRHVVLWAQETVTKKTLEKTKNCLLWSQPWKSPDTVCESGMLLSPWPVWAALESCWPAEQCWSLGWQQGAASSHASSPQPPCITFLSCSAASPSLLLSRLYCGRDSSRTLQILATSSA